MTKLKPQDVDGGYSYAILIGCSMMYMLVIGGAKSYGLLYTEMLNYYHGSASGTGWVTGINTCIITIMGPLSNSLAKRYSFRKVTFIGGLLAGSGFVMSAFVPSLEWTYLSFGVVSGVGFGLALSPSTTLVSYFFKKHRFLANGITFACSGIWAASLSFVYDVLVKTYGLRGTLLILGAINFNICAAACFFIQPNELDRTNNQIIKSSTETVTCCEKFFSKIRWIAEEIKTNIALFSIPSFSSFQFCLMLMMFSYTGGLVLMAAEVDARSLPKIDESINIAILGVCDVAARVFFGWFSDLKLIHTRYIYIVNIMFGAVFNFLTPFIGSLVFLRIYAGSVGLFLASYMALLPPFLIESFGMERFSQSMGLSFMSMSIVTLISHPVLGATADATGNWKIAFLVCGMLLVVAALILAVEPFLTKMCNRKQMTVEDEPKEWNTRL